MSKFRACLAVLLVCLATLVSLPSDVQAQTLGGGAGHATAPLNTGPMQEWMDTDASNTANAMICAVIGDLGGTKLAVVLMDEGGMVHDERGVYDHKQCPNQELVD